MFRHSLQHSNEIADNKNSDVQFQLVPGSLLKQKFLTKRKTIMGSHRAAHQESIQQS